MSLAPDVTVAETIEATVRKHMACVTPDRGFDSRRMRETEMARLNELIDSYNLLVLGR